MYIYIYIYILGNSEIYFSEILRYDGQQEIPQIEIYVKHNLKFTIRIFAWCIPSDHGIYNL